MGGGGVFLSFQWTWAFLNHPIASFVYFEFVLHVMSSPQFELFHHVICLFVQLSIYCPFTCPHRGFLPSVVLIHTYQRMVMFRTKGEKMYILTTTKLLCCTVFPPIPVVDKYSCHYHGRRGPPFGGILWSAPVAAVPSPKGHPFRHNFPRESGDPWLLPPPDQFWKRWRMDMGYYLNNVGV